MIWGVWILVILTVDRVARLTAGGYGVQSK